MFNKTIFRQSLCANRSQLKPEFIQQASHKVIDRLLQLSAFIRSQSIGLYVAARGELDPIGIVQYAARLGKKLFLPVISDSSENKLLFYSYQLGDVLKNNRFNIPEPDSSRQFAIEITQLDLIVIPLVGFDESGHRLGMGAGYYDRSLMPIMRMLPPYRPVLIGLGYEFQKIDRIMPDAWDIPMDYVITEEKIYKRLN